MQVVILAGGLGTRISEETNFIPKPMIKIGSKPIIWHIMKYYASYGVSDFIICGGYKINKIKSFFKFRKNIKKWNVKIYYTIFAVAFIQNQIYNKKTVILLIMIYTNAIITTLLF